MTGQRESVAVAPSMPPASAPAFAPPSAWSGLPFGVAELLEHESALSRQGMPRSQGRVDQFGVAELLEHESALSRQGMPRSQGRVDRVMGKRLLAVRSHAP